MKKLDEFRIMAKVWVYRGPAAWHFVTLPKKDAEVIEKYFSDFSRKWGSIPVTVKINKTIWDTSIFKDRNTGSFLLPIKGEGHLRKVCPGS